MGFLCILALNHPSLSRTLCAFNSLILQKIEYRYFKRFMFRTFVHIVLPAQKHSLSLVLLHTHMVQEHYSTCKVRYLNFLAMEMVAFRASCHRNICLS